MNLYVIQFTTDAIIYQRYIIEILRILYITVVIIIKYTFINDIYIEREIC